MYIHTTDIDTLKNILAGDRKLHTLKQLAELYPDVEGSVEYKYNSAERKRDTLKALYDLAVENGKQTDAVFFTKDRYVPEYGDVLIAKDFKPRAVSENKRWTTIPEEYLRKNKAVSLRNATIYVPEEAAAEIQEQFPDVKGIQPYTKGTLDIPRVTALTRLAAGITNAPKLLKSASTGDELANEILTENPKAVLVGSVGLGIDNNSSDHDIMIPINTELGKKRLLNRLLKKYPDLQITRQDDRKTTFTGDIDNSEFNIALVPKDLAEPFINSYQQAKEYLDSHEAKRRRIRTIKRFLSKLPVRAPYKVYKKYVDHDLGISKNYF